MNRYCEMCEAYVSKMECPKCGADTEPVPKDTHYLPAFTDSRGSHQRAVCGAWIFASLHSAEPTCAKCMEWIDADEKGSASLDGVTGTPLSEVPDRADDITGGRPRARR